MRMRAKVRVWRRELRGWECLLNPDPLAQPPHQSTATFTTALRMVVEPFNGAWASPGKNTAKQPGETTKFNCGLSPKKTMSFSLSNGAAVSLHAAVGRQPNSCATAP